MRGVTVTVCGLDIGIHISTHTPHARRDTGVASLTWASAAFQLTRLMRGVTFPNSIGWVVKSISTHTPHARRDEKGDRVELIPTNFNSHASCEA